MPKIQIEEADHKALVETAGRVETLERERDTEKTRADVAEAKVAEHDRTDAARSIIAEADVDFDDLQTDGLLAKLPVKESGEFDADAFKTRVTEAAAKVKAARGAGTVTGFGSTAGGETSEISESDIDNVVAGAFGRKVQEA